MLGFIELSLDLTNVLSPPVLFFFLGMAACLSKSDLDIPQPIPKALSLYLLLAIGFKGGIGLRESGATMEVMLTLGAAVAMSAITPFFCFFVLNRWMERANAAAISATYGSISAVTFLAASTYLTSIGGSYGGHMVAAMALMESPAIIAGVLLARLGAEESNNSTETSSPYKRKGIKWGALFHDSFLNGSVFLLTGSLIIGFFAPEESKASMLPFTKEIFYGLLCFFLLDMGLVAARRLSDLIPLGVKPIAFGLVFPLVNGSLAIGIAWALGFSPGNAFLFIVLCASASYIAVPAAMRLAVPEANPSLYVPMALAITFPFNLIIGLPIYAAMVEAVIGPFTTAG